MNTLQLVKLLPYTDACVGGVYPSDKIPCIWPRPCAIIANTDDHTKPGTHWVAFFVNKHGHGIYFDSFGRPPGDSRFTQRLGRNCRRGYKWNQQQLQDINSNYCGQYCIVVLHWLSNNKSLSSFLNLFGKDTKRNDRSLIKMFKKISKKKDMKNKLKKPFKNLSGGGRLYSQSSVSK